MKFDFACWSGKVRHASACAIIGAAIAFALSLPSAITPSFAYADDASDDIVILYENDAHCAIEGYSKLAALKSELQQTYEHVGVVSSGDYIQGASLGVVSEGGYVIELINMVGYDALALGNHEFDYRLLRLGELVSQMNVKPVCCNFQKVGEEKPCFDAYSIVSYGDIDIAYIGITTPSTITSVYPAQFKNEQGDFIYTFNATTLPDVVQASIDSALAEGADYVIALSHLGDKEENYDVLELIANTEGFDVVLDAHSHSVIEHATVKDKGGNDVVLTSTGTKFEHIGKLTISDDGISTELIDTESYANTDPAVDARIAGILEEYSELGNRVVATSDVELLTYDADGNRLVRVSETNLGILCADAFRAVLGADVGYMNGGGLRANIGVGDVTFNNLLTVLPYNNQPALIEVSGQALKDMFEMTLRTWPEENGSFPHVSGIKFSVNTSIPSSVVIDENEEFVEVAGDYRIYDMKILDSKTGEYMPLDLDATYKLAAQNFYAIECGGGMNMLKDATVLRNDGTLDVEVLEQYVADHLGGIIGLQYAELVSNITFTDGVVSDGDGSESDSDADSSEGGPAANGSEASGGMSAPALVAGVLVVALLIAVVVVFVRKRRGALR